MASPTPVTPHSSSAHLGVPGAVSSSSVYSSSAPASTVFSSSASVLSTPADDDGPGEYEVASRERGHTYHGIDGRAIASKPEPPLPIPDWKPFALRWPFLTALILTLLGVIAATEYACRVLPAEQDRNAIPIATVAPVESSTTTAPSFAFSAVSRRGFIGRRTNGTETTSPTKLTTTSTSLTSSTSSISSTSSTSSPTSATSTSSSSSLSTALSTTKSTASTTTSGRTKGGSDESSQTPVDSSTSTSVSTASSSVSVTRETDSLTTVSTDDPTGTDRPTLSQRPTWRLTHPGAVLSTGGFGVIGPITITTSPRRTTTSSDRAPPQAHVTETPWTTTIRSNNFWGGGGGGQITITEGGDERTKDIDITTTRQGWHWPGFETSFSFPWGGPTTRTSTGVTDKPPPVQPAQETTTTAPGFIKTKIDVTKDATSSLLITLSPQSSDIRPPPSGDESSRAPTKAQLTAGQGGGGPSETAESDNVSFIVTVSGSGPSATTITVSQSQADQDGPNKDPAAYTGTPKSSLTFGSIIVVPTGNGQSTTISGDVFTTVIYVVRVTTLSGVPTHTVVPTTRPDGVVTSNTISTTLGRLVTMFTAPSTVRAVAPPMTVVYVTAETVTTADAGGRPTVVTVTPSPIYATVALILTDQADGRPTSTVMTAVPVAPRTVTLSDAAGRPTATETRFPVFPHMLKAPVPGSGGGGASSGSSGGANGGSGDSGVESGVRVYYLSNEEYFVGFFLPTFLSVLLMIPVRMVETSARQLQPFQRLTHDRGAPARESVCLRTGLWNSIPAAFRTLSVLRAGGGGAGGPAGGGVAALLENPPVAFLSKCLLLASTVIIPLFPEAVGLKLHGACKADDFHGCAMVLSVFPGPARAAMGMLALMTALAALILASLPRWTTGVAANPWTIAGVAGLVGNREVRSLVRGLRAGRVAASEEGGKEGKGLFGTGFWKGRMTKGTGRRHHHEGPPFERRITRESLLEAVGDRKFKLGYYASAGEACDGGKIYDYGVVISSEGGMLLRGQRIDPAARLPAGAVDGDGDGGSDYEDGSHGDSDSDATEDPGAGDDAAHHSHHHHHHRGRPRLGRAATFAALRGSGDGRQQAKKEHHLPFMMLSHTPRLLFIALVTGLLILTLYYYNSAGGDKGFERFMNHQDTGVRFLFTAVGVGIAFFWSSFFTNVAIISPYLLLSHAPQAARVSVLMPPPTNAFEGLWVSLRRRHYYLASVAFVAILAELTPTLLNNVPFRLTKTYATHQVCTWAAVAILSLMLAVVLASFFVEWPHMPVDPSSPLGAMYYVADSWMLWAFEGTGVVGEAARDRGVEGLGMWYEFGVMAGCETGARRIGVEARMPVCSMGDEHHLGGGAPGGSGGHAGDEGKDEDRSIGDGSDEEVDRDHER